MAEAEVQLSSPKLDDEANSVAADVESQIQSAMSARVPHFKDQADSLTFEGVRRLLEKDLGLKTYALDVHKKFIKQCLLKSLDDGGDDNGSKGSLETVGNNVSTRKGRVEDSAERELAKIDVKETSFMDGEKMDDSPVMGLLSGQNNKAKAQAKDTEFIGEKGLLTESIVKDAVWKRTSYLKANSSEITMAGVRKLLEEDLELEKNSLLPFKKFINEQIDLLLNTPKVSKPMSIAKKKDSQKSFCGKPSKKESGEESGDSLDSESEEDAKTRKKAAARRKLSEEPKKRKVPATGTKVSNKKRLKVVGKNNDAEAGSASEDDGSPSSDEKSAKKKEVSTLSYGKRVERLKSVIKSCGMSVPPVVYKKAKQVSEDKREAFVRKELEEILSREGLSADPSEKEIKDVKKRKERAKELEGIDMSNIVSSTRRRSSTSFIPPPKPKVTVESKDDDTEDSSNDEGDPEDNSDEGDSEDNSDEGGDSQSEEGNEESDEDNSD